MEKAKETYRVLCRDLENGSKWMKDFEDDTEAEKYALEQAWQGVFVRIACL